MAKIVFEHVTKTFPTKDKKNKEQFTALDGIDLEIEAGEFVVVVGPSGCGKSTLLDLLGGLTRPSSGRILLDGKPITGPGLDRGIVFQQYALLPWRTALGNVEFGLEATGVRRRERASRARSSWTSSASPASRTGTRTNSPAVCASAWPSPARWLTTPTCC